MYICCIEIPYLSINPNGSSSQQFEILNMYGQILDSAGTAGVLDILAKKVDFYSMDLVIQV